MILRDLDYFVFKQVDRQKKVLKVYYTPSLFSNSKGVTKAMHWEFHCSSKTAL